MWSRLNNVAHQERMTLEQLAEFSDYELMRWPTLGRKSVQLLRSRYPGLAPSMPPISDKGRIIQELEQARAAITVALKLLTERP